MLWVFGVRSFYTIVEAGTVEIKKTFGYVAPDVFYPGFNLKNPLTETIWFDTRTRQYTMSFLASNSTTGVVDPISALTKEGLSIDVDLTVLYHLVPEKAPEVYQTIGVNYESQIIRPLIRSTVRDVIALYEAKDVYSEKRPSVTEDIFTRLSEELDKRGLVLENILIRDVQLPKELQASIETKLTAEQEAQKYDFILQTEQKEAERKKIEAEGQAASQRIVSESLTKEYLQYLYINSLKDRQGTIYVPVNPDNGMPLFKNVE